MKKLISLLLSLGVVAVLMATTMAQTKQGVQINPDQIDKVSPGKGKLTGTIVSRDVETVIIKDVADRYYKILLDNSTKVEEKKSNPFRGSKKYGPQSLLPGLNVEVEGRGDAGGALVAEKVKMTETARQTATTIDTRMKPVEGRVDKAENRIGQVEENARRISGQIDELGKITEDVRVEAKTAQKSADVAIAGVQQTNKRIDQLVTSLDEYQEKTLVTVNFKVGSADLQPEAMATLDQIASQIKGEKAYVIEVTGHASAEGKADLNLRLSKQRADAVVSYLAMKHEIPLRRIITPLGAGTIKPAADNSTKDGREQNRRVEVRVLVNKGLTAPPPAITVSRPNSPGSEQQQ